MGNYWSDYNGIDSNGDCIGDTPYSIPGNYSGILDHFPLMACWFSTETVTGGIPGYDVIYMIGIIGVISITMVLLFKRRIKMS